MAHCRLNQILWAVEFKRHMIEKWWQLNTGKAVLCAALSIANPLLSIEGIADGSASEGPVVRVEQGYLRGHGLESDPGIFVFRGIPFAAPPSGTLRWRPPQPVQPWKGVRGASEIGPVCWQPHPGTIPNFDFRFDEDCLNLNVWTPTNDRNARLPVIVWIHGGGHHTGSGSAPWLSGHYMARKGVVYVTFNYRLGVLGFLVHRALDAEAESGVSGNYGVMDQVAALTWIKRNIQAFGGDPNRITVSGYSAGGVSLQYLLMSERVRSLFRRGISHSGGYGLHLVGPDTRKVSSGLTAYEEGANFARHHGIEGTDVAAASALRAIAPEEIHADGPWRGYPIIDGDYLPGSYAEQYSKGATVSIDLMIGTTSHEGNGNWRFHWGRQPDEDYDLFLRRLLAGGPPGLIDRYRRSDDLSGPDAAARLETDMQSATRHALLRRYVAAHPDRAVYSYLFAHPMPHFAARTLGMAPASRELGAFHGASLPFVNNSLGYSKSLPLEEADFRLAEMVSGYIVNFAAHGNPNGSGLPEWPPYAPMSATEFVIDETPGLRPIAERQQLELMMRVIDDVAVE